MNIAPDGIAATDAVTITLTLSNEQAATLLEACKHAGAAAASEVYGIPASEVYGEGDHGKPDPNVYGKPDPDVRALDRLIALNALVMATRQAMD